MNTAMFTDIKDVAKFISKAKACDAKEPYQIFEDGSFYVDYVVAVKGAERFINQLLDSCNGCKLAESSY